MFMNLPINMIPRKQKKPPKRNSSGAFYFAPGIRCAAWGYDRESGASLPKFPYLLNYPRNPSIFIAVILISRLPDNRAGEDGCGFHFHDANHWLDISFLFHIYFYYYFLLLDDNLHGLAATLHDVHTLLQIL